MTSFPDLFAALAAPFEPGQVKTLKAKGNSRYITARTAMNRLDEVLGPENWWARFEVVNSDSVLCYLTIRLPDGREITKSDLGGAAGMADAGDDDKSAASDALKRAAVHFGVARYLYGDGVPSYRAVSPPPAQAPPQPRAVPAPQRASLPAPVPVHEPGGDDDAEYVDADPGIEASTPANGQELYRALVRLRDQSGIGSRVNPLRDAIQWGSKRGLKSQMAGWDQRDVAACWHHVAGELQTA